MHDSILAGNVWQGAGTPILRGGQTARRPAGRSDVSVILTDDGKMVEWVKYTPNGEPIAVPAGDTNGDFAWDAADEGRMSSISHGFYDVRYDTTLDGTISAADITHANSITGGYQTLGRGVLSSDGVENRIGYAGYRYDHHLGGGAGAGRHLYHVRYRVYQPHIGRWAMRDPLGYVDGMSLYEYVRSQPVLRSDPSGLLSPPPLEILDPDTGPCPGANCGDEPYAPACPSDERYWRRWIDLVSQAGPGVVIPVYSSIGGSAQVAAYKSACIQCAATGVQTLVPIYGGGVLVWSWVSCQGAA